MNLKELALINGISIATAKRYKRDGVNLADAKAVGQHMFAQRSRRGVSKFFHRTVSGEQRVTVATQSLEQKIEDLEEIICSIYWLAVESRTRSSRTLAAEIIEHTTPVIDRIGAEG